MENQQLNATTNQSQAGSSLDINYIQNLDNYMSSMFGSANESLLDSKDIVLNVSKIVINEETRLEEQQKQNAIILAGMEEKIQQHIDFNRVKLSQSQYLRYKEYLKEYNDERQTILNRNMSELEQDKKELQLIYERYPARYQNAYIAFQQKCKEREMRKELFERRVEATDKEFNSRLEKIPEIVKSFFQKATLISDMKIMPTEHKFNFHCNHCGELLEFQYDQMPFIVYGKYTVPVQNSKGETKQVTIPKKDYIRRVNTPELRCSKCGYIELVPFDIVKQLVRHYEQRIAADKTNQVDALPCNIYLSAKDLEPITRIEVAQTQSTIEVKESGLGKTITGGDVADKNLGFLIESIKKKEEYKAKVNSVYKYMTGTQKSYIKAHETTIIGYEAEFAKTTDVYRKSDILNVTMQTVSQIKAILDEMVKLIRDNEIETQDKSLKGIFSSMKKVEKECDEIYKKVSTIQENMIKAINTSGFYTQPTHVVQVPEQKPVEEEVISLTEPVLVQMDNKAEKLIRLEQAMDYGTKDLDSLTYEQLTAENKYYNKSILCLAYDIDESDFDTTEDVLMEIMDLRDIENLPKAIREKIGQEYKTIDVTGDIFNSLF